MQANLVRATESHFTQLYRARCSRSRSVVLRTRLSLLFSLTVQSIATILISLLFVKHFKEVCEISAPFSFNSLLCYVIERDVLLDKKAICIFL